MYAVYSKPRGTEMKVLEVTRSNKDAALKDVQLLRQICGKYAWMEEIQSKEKSK